MRLADILSRTAPELRERVSECLTLLVRQAGAAARLQGRVEALMKADDSPVTVVDLLHQTQFQQLVARRWPGDAMLCEEPRSLQESVLGRTAELSREEYGVALEPTLAELPTVGEKVWVLDPIDGTKGFLNDRCFAIAAGYFERGEPRFGAMAVPGSGGPGLAVNRSVAFALSDGGGAWLARLDAGGDELEWRRLGGPATPSGRIRVAVSLAHGGVLAERVRASSEVEVVRLDSQAKYLAVAAGAIDAYVRAARDDGHPDVLWDHMPGGVIASEAGCRVEHFDGSRVEYRPEMAIGFRGGLVCLRERASGEVAAVVGRLLVPV